MSEWAVFAIRNLRENHINNQRIIEALRRQGTINKQMMKQMNKNIATSNYRFCVPGYKEIPDNGLPIELLEMSQSERKRYLKAYFSSGEPELSPNNSYSSDSSSGTESKKRNKSRRKRRKPKREYHKYSSSSSSPTMFVSDVEYEDDEDEERESSNDNKNSDQSNSNTETKWNNSNEFEAGPHHNCEYESEEECATMLSSINLNASTRNNKNSRNENAFLYENFEKDEQQRRFTE